MARAFLVARRITWLVATPALCALSLGCQPPPPDETIATSSPSPTAPPAAPTSPPSPPPACTPTMRGAIGVDRSHARLEPYRRLREQGVPVSGCPLDGGASMSGGFPVDAGLGPPPASSPDAASPSSADTGAPLADDDAAAPTSDDAGAPPPSLDAGPTWDGGPSLDWNFATTGPVNAAVAIVTPSYPSAGAADAIYFGAESGSPNFWMLTNIYATTPTVSWSATTGGLFGTAVALSADSSAVFALDKTGALFCFAAANGGMCPGWPAQSVNPGVNHAVSWSSPWLDYASNTLYYGDSSGYLFKVNAATGATVWSYALSTAPIESDPIFWEGYAYLGDTQGNIYRVQDPGASAPTSADVAAFSDCAPSCTAFSPIETGPAADLGTGQIFFAGNGKVFQFPVGAGAWTPTATVSLDMPPGLNVSSPVVDGAGTLYVGFYGGLFRAPYPLTASHPVGAFLYGQGSPSSSPRSGPTVYNGSVYIGDPAGMAEQYSCLTRASAPALDAVTTAYGSTVDSTPLVDYVNGNVVFGYGTAAGAGGLVQITQMGGWGCGGQAPCANAGCGSGSVCAPGMGCVPDMVPPSVTWLSGGGGTSTLADGGSSIALSIGGLCAGDVATIGGNPTLWFGTLADETF